jgi:hypothetical protein
MIYSIKCALFASPSTFIFLAVTVALAIWLVIRRRSIPPVNEDVILYSPDRSLFWRFLERTIGKLAFVVWVFFVCSTLFSLCDSIRNSATQSPPLSMLAVGDIYAFSIMGLMAITSYSLCFVAELSSIRKKRQHYRQDKQHIVLSSQHNSKGQTN